MYSDILIIHEILGQLSIECFILDDEHILFICFEIVVNFGENFSISELRLGCCHDYFKYHILFIAGLQQISIEKIGFFQNIPQNGLNSLHL